MVVWHRKWVLHPVVAPIKDQKNVSKCPQNYYFRDVKMNFFLGRGHSPLPRPLPRTPPPWRLAAPPLSEILNTPLPKSLLFKWQINFHVNYWDVCKLQCVMNRFSSVVMAVGWSHLFRFRNLYSLYRFQISSLCVYLIPHKVHLWTLCIK